jgi:hypothetical protein
MLQHLRHGLGVFSYVEVAVGHASFGVIFQGSLGVWSPILAENQDLVVHESLPPSLPLFSNSIMPPRGIKEPGKNDFLTYVL